MKNLSDIPAVVGSILQGIFVEYLLIPIAAFRMIYQSWNVLFSVRI